MGSEGNGKTFPRMTPRELYRFDVQGFLVVRGALTPAEVSRLNEAFDANADKLHEVERHIGPSGTLAGNPQMQSTGMLEWERPWCEPFRELLAHPRIVPYLNSLLGRGWRMDHMPIYFQAPKGTTGLGFHLGDYYFVDGAFYTYKAGQIRSGLTVLQWVLADQGGDLGGFACIPGTHKANFPRPVEISLWEQDQDMFVCPEAKAGDLIIFTEATTHGTLPWTGDHDRRSLLYRYTPRYVQFARGAHSYELPSWVAELDEAARLAMEPPYIHERQVLLSDGQRETPGIFQDPPPFAYDVPS